jgi:alpha-N-arabinofuranosidase
VLHTVVRSPAYANAKHGDVPYLDAVATVDRGAGGVTLFCVNRSGTERIELSGRLGRFPDCRLVEHITLAHPDRRAANTRDNPVNVVPFTADATRVDGEVFHSVLPPLSWNVLRFGFRGEG